MDKRDVNLTRLLKLAVTAKDEMAVEAPFGFDTRVLARWREIQQSGNGDLTRFVRRIAFAAIAVTILGGIATYRQTNEEEEIGEPLTNDYALVDSAIQRQFTQ